MFRWLCFWRPCLLRRVIVNFTATSTEAVGGVLWSWRGGWLTLKQPIAYKAGIKPEKLPGDVVIHRSQIQFLQDEGPTAPTVLQDEGP